MPADLRVVTSPLHLWGRRPLAQLAVLVAVDVLLRRARAEGRHTAWVPPSMAGDIAGQREVERELAREGLTRDALGREAFEERVRTAEAAARERLAVEVSALAVETDVEGGALDGDGSVRAARTAFVRLFEQGLVSEAEQVVDVCTRCATVVDRADSQEVMIEGERLVVRFGDLDVPVVSPELLSGAVAVAVPDGHAAAGTSVPVPLAGHEVPVVADADVLEPTPVVPAHDEWAYALARQFGIVPVPVIGDSAVVARPGPLYGLARFAAKAAARALLDEQGLVVSAEPVTETARLCRRCGTVLLPIAGRHWFLDVGDLEAAAADAVRSGDVVFSPPSARDEFLDRAGRGGTWCLSQHVWGGQPVPISTCADCGRPAVGVDPADSCGKCMGTLTPDDSALDARFVASLWPLADAGWPDDEGGPVRLAPATHLQVGAGGVARWVLPMAALALRLTGELPFATVTVTPVDTLPDERELPEPVDIPALVEEEGTPVVRAAIVGGDLDLDGARALVSRLATPPEGDADVDELAGTYDAAFAAGTPWLALRLLAAALEEGVRPGAADRLRALAAPFVAD